MDIDSGKLSAIMRGLLTEAYDGPENPRMTWFADNEPACGLLGTLERISAEEASRPFRAEDGAGAATHAGHILFSLRLANEALRGGHPHETAVWKDSWKYGKVDEAEWRALLSALRAEYRSLMEAVAAGLPWTDDMNFTGVFGQLAHGAWHLGAIRQGLGLVRTPTAR